MRNGLDSYHFTPAAGRALRAAANWTGGGTSEIISPCELLMGLLAETESRAAGMLAARGINAAAVLARWPELVVRNNETTAVALSPDVQEALADASYLLADFPRPLELATEHLLLGLVASRGELADWLAERGFDADRLGREIHRLYGYDRNGDADTSALLPPDDGLPIDTFSAAAPLERVSCEPGTAALPNASTTEAAERRAETALYRLLDAAANRAREGLRVLEDFVRFVCNDRHLTSQLKQLRHDLAAALGRISAPDLLASRDTPADVGTAIVTDAERARSDVENVVTANAKRLQESLRSLEEYGKIFSPEMAAEIEQLRYRCYTLERSLAATLFGLRRLAHARLYVLIDGRSTSAAFERLVEDLVTAGVHVLQLRDKQLPDRELLDRARRLRALTAASETLFVMNDRPDLAALAQADGVHVGQEELSVAACRAIVGPRMLVGVSTHSLTQVRQAVLDGANYLGVGPTFASRTKRFTRHALRGPELLKAAQAEVRLPLFAIGGIDLANLPEVLATGVTRVAVSGAILSSEKPAQAARDILAQLRATAGPGMSNRAI